MGMEAAEVDELLESIEAPRGERPMSGGEESPATGTAPQAPAAPDPNAWRQNFQWEFDHGGKKVSPDSADKARTWMQLGYQANTRFQELKSREAEFQKQRQEIEARGKHYSQYDEVDKYARQNPEWWNHVEEQYKQRAVHGLDPSLAPIVQPLMQRLEATEGFIQTMQQAEEERKLAEHDQALAADVETIRKDFPTIDLAATDPETGRTLEWKVLNHAQQNGIHSFRAAFKDLFYDKLVEEAKAASLSTIAKGHAGAAKRGVLGHSPVPTKTLKPAQNVRGKSYEDLTQEALQELGIG